MRLTPRTLTAEISESLLDRACAMVASSRRSQSRVECSDRRVYVIVCSAGGLELARYRADKSGVLRPWRSEWKRT